MGRIATLLSHYWRADDPDEIIEANMRDWCDVLEHLPQAAIQSACLRWLSNASGHKPTPGQIAALARDAMPAPRVVKLAEPPPKPVERVSRERAAEIMAEAGFRPRRFGGSDAQD